MILFSPAPFSLDRVLHRCVLYALSLSSLFCVGLLVFLSLSSHADTGASLLLDHGSVQKGKRPQPYELIGSGPLALKASHALGWVARLADELMVNSYNSRPDMDVKQTEILLRLKQGKEQATVLNGRVVYLKESDTGKGLLISAEPTSLWIKPIILDRGSVLLEVGRKLVSLEGEVGEEKGQFITGLQGSSMKPGDESQRGAAELRSASCFLQDVFMQKYGGREYANWHQKAILDMATSDAAYALVVSPGDYLLYRDRQWHQVSFQELQSDAPIAYVRAVSERGADIDVWDEKGFVPVQLKVEVKRQPIPPFGPESIPTSIRLRTGTQVSCAFGKRRLILKQGDWLIKTGNGWRHLRTAEDIESFLYRRLKGDLFVFDVIEKDPQGKFMMKGHLFDETRTYMQPVNLPIQVANQQTKTARKRRAAAVSRK